MSKDLMLYAAKLHSAARYKDFAFACKPFSAALQARIDAFSKQDEKHAEIFLKRAAPEEHLIDAIGIHRLQVEDDPDREPEDIAIEVVTQIMNYECGLGQLFEQLGLESISLISKHRHDMMGRVLKYIQEGSLFGRKDKISWWECSVCGHLHYVKNPQGEPVYPPEECPGCASKISAFVRHNEIGGWI